MIRNFPFNYIGIFYLEYKESCHRINCTISYIKYIIKV